MPPEFFQIVGLAAIVIGAAWKLSSMLSEISTQLKTLGDDVKGWNARHDRIESRLDRLEARQDLVESLMENWAE